jgi:hypothetical protein
LVWWDERFRVRSLVPEDTYGFVVRDLMRVQETGASALTSGWIQFVDRTARTLPVGSVAVFVYITATRYLGFTMSGDDLAGEADEALVAAFRSLLHRSGRPAAAPTAVRNEVACGLWRMGTRARADEPPAQL